jgi:CO/xanthine dehydrogenase FAD-binding subunit
MKPFDYERAADAAGAVTTVTDRPDAVFLAGARTSSIISNSESQNRTSSSTSTAST